MKFVFFVFFPVSVNGENGLGDEGADEAMPSHNFWARIAPGRSASEGLNRHAVLAS